MKLLSNQNFLKALLAGVVFLLLVSLLANIVFAFMLVREDEEVEVDPGFGSVELLNQSEQIKKFESTIRDYQTQVAGLREDLLEAEDTIEYLESLQTDPNEYIGAEEIGFNFVQPVSFIEIDTTEWEDQECRKSDRFYYSTFPPDINRQINIVLEEDQKSVPSECDQDSVGPRTSRITTITNLKQPDYFESMEVVFEVGAVQFDPEHVTAYPVNVVVRGFSNGDYITMSHRGVMSDYLSQSEAEQCLEDFNGNDYIDGDCAAELIDTQQDVAHARELAAQLLRFYEFSR